MAGKKKTTKKIVKSVQEKPIKNKPIEEKKSNEKKTLLLERQFLGISYQLWLIAIILIGIMIIFVYTQYKGPQEIDNNDINNGIITGGLQIVIVTDDIICPECYKNSTIINELEKNKIQYKVKLVNSNSELGQEAIQRYKIKHFPTYLIDVNTITSKTIIETANGTKANLLDVLKFYETKFNKLSNYRGISKYNFRYHETDNVFVLEDVFEWDYEQHISYIVDANTTDTRMKLFYDPFNPYFLLNYSEISTKLKQMDMDFYFLPQETSYFAEAYYAGNGDYSGWMNAPKYFTCMSRQGLFWDFADEYVKVYCDINSIEDSANCSQSQYYEKPLLEAQLIPIKNKLIKDGKLDQTQFAICFGKGMTETKKDIDIAGKLYVSESPVLVKGNIYQGFLANIEGFVCIFNEYSALKMCSK